MISLRQEALNCDIFIRGENDKNKASLRAAVKRYQVCSIELPQFEYCGSWTRSQVSPVLETSQQTILVLPSLF